MNFLNITFMWTIVFIIYVQEYNADIQCEPPQLKNGKVRTKQRGKLARFQCFWNYELMGQRYSICVQGKWDTPTPICIKPGCKNPLNPKNGIGIFSRRNAAVMFFCNPGFTLQGSSKMYCDGRVWNDTTPTCVGNENSMPAITCDFEEADLCGWSPDPMHDFDWRRQMRSTPSGHIGTGPNYDHTKGFGKDGFYMYIESSSRVENDTARLISPIYPSSLSQSGCFVFYYHMYGRTTGTLRVLVYPETVDLPTIINSTRLRQRYTMFEKSGNQGNVWFRGFFELDEMDADFQIVIEGVRGSGYISDIAIDDVAILQSEKCIAEKEDNNKTLIVADSCLNRCGKHLSEDVNIETECECTEDCEIQNSCCVDYRDLCIFADTSITEGSLETNPSTTSSTNQSLSIENANALPLEGHEIQYSTTTDDYRTMESNNSTTAINNSTTETDIETTTENVVETTETTPLTTIKQTTSTTTVSTTIKISSTTARTIPKLRFADKTPPIKNATGILNKWPPKTANESNPKIFIKKPTTVSKIQTTSTLKTTSYAKYTTKPMLMVQNFSKAYFHYGKGDDGKNIPVTTKKTIKSEKIIFNQDALENSSASQDPESISVLSIIFIAIGILICVLFFITLLKSETFIQRMEIARTKFTRLRRRNNEEADIRFLVEDEKLEHDLID